MHIFTTLGQMVVLILEIHPSPQSVAGTNQFRREMLIQRPAILLSILFIVHLICGKGDKSRV